MGLGMKTAELAAYAGEQVEYQVGKFYTVTLGNGHSAQFQRCTTIVGTLPKPWMGRWASKMVAEYANEHWKRLATVDTATREKELKGAPWAKRDAAGDRGTIIHNTIDKFISGGTLDIEMTPDEKACSMGAVSFLSGAGLGTRNARTEVSVINSRYGIAGTVDLIDRSLDGTRWMLDWKTSRSIYSEHAVQQAVYQKSTFALYDKKEIGNNKWLATLVPWEPAARIGIVHVPPTHCKMHEIRPDQWERLWTVARAARHIKQWKDDTDDYGRRAKTRTFEEPTTYTSSGEKDG